MRNLVPSFVPVKLSIGPHEKTWDESWDGPKGFNKNYFSPNLKEMGVHHALKLHSLETSKEKDLNDSKNTTLFDFRLTQVQVQKLGYSNVTGHEANEMKINTVCVCSVWEKRTKVSRHACKCLWLGFPLPCFNIFESTCSWFMGGCVHVWIPTKVGAFRHVEKYLAPGFCMPSICYTGTIEMGLDWGIVQNQNYMRFYMRIDNQRRESNKQVFSVYASVWNPSLHFICFRLYCNRKLYCLRKFGWTGSSSLPELIVNQFRSKID